MLTRRLTEAACRSRVVVLLVLAALLPLAAQALEVKEGHVRGLPPTQRTTAAFLTLVNTGSEAVRLTGARTPAAARAEVHSHEHRDGAMRMRRVDSVEIPAGKRLALEPGGYHLMLVDLTEPLSDGDTVELELQFENRSPLSVELPVRSVLDEHRHERRSGGH